MIYRPIEYIKSTGTQYIDAGLKGNNNSKIQLKINLTTTATASMHLLGDFSNTAKAITFNLNSSGSPTSRWGNKSTTTILGITGGNDYIISISKDGYIVNDVLKWQPVANTFETNKNLLLFNAYKGDGTASTTSYKGKIYYCKIYNGDNLVRDFIPVIDNNNVACMYDKVENRAYYNQGTGTFTAGDYLYDDLIYDRTQEDVEYALSNPDSISFLKGSYNYTDLNRIEKWCEYLEEQLNKYSYSVSITTKTDWTIDDFPIKVQLERIRNNVESLKEAFVAFTTIPDNLEKMTYTKANAIEKVLSELDTLIDNMIMTFYYSGEIYAGEVY